MEPRSYLQAVFEETATTLGLDRGQHRLELVFDDGVLRTWFAHAEKRRPGELALFDVAVDELLDRARIRAQA